MRKYSKSLKTNVYKCHKGDVKFHDEMRERCGQVSSPARSSLMCRVSGFMGREDMSKGKDVRRFRDKSNSE